MWLALVLSGGQIVGVLRLSTAVSDLDEPISSSSPEKSQRAGWVAAQWAIRMSSLSHPAVNSARLGGPIDSIAALAKELDELYLSQQELCELYRCTKEEVLDAFARARAAKSLECAVRGEAAEAIYEAAVCCDDAAELRSVVMASLAEDP